MYICRIGDSTAYYRRENRHHVRTDNREKLLDDLFVIEHYNVAPYPTMEVERLGLPNVRFVDGPRGVVAGSATCFPVSMARGATFDRELEEEIGKCIGAEVRAVGGNYYGGVCINLLRNPRWGRAQECYGEDQYHLGEMGAALTRGVQSQNVMACVKHYALYGAAEAGRDYNTVDMSRVTAMNYYMRPYQAAVEAGVGSIMTSFNEFESIPATGNTWLLNDVLRKQWGFNGFVVSDFTAIAEMVNHGIGNSQEVGVKALKAGVDMDMIADCYHAVLKKSLEEGKITEAEIDSACELADFLRFNVAFAEQIYKQQPETPMAYGTVPSTVLWMAL